MTTVTKNGITLTYTGAGSETASVSGEVNEGIDRSTQFVLGNGSSQATLDVLQLGKREVFNASDGSFLLSDGTTFNVLKTNL